MEKPNTTSSTQEPQHCMHVAAYYGHAAEVMAKIPGGWMRELAPREGFNLMGGERWLVGNLRMAIEHAQKCAREMRAAGLITDRTNHGAA